MESQLSDIQEVFELHVGTKPSQDKTKFAEKTFTRSRVGTNRKYVPC